MVHKICDGKVGLVRNDSALYARRAKPIDGIDHAGIGGGGIKAVVGIMFFKRCKNFPTELIWSSFGHCIVDKFGDSITNEVLDLVNRIGGHIVLFESVIGCPCKVNDGIEKCSVKIKHCSFVWHSKTSFFSAWQKNRCVQSLQ